MSNLDHGRFAVHLNGYPNVMCGIPCSSASIVTDKLTRVTCPKCIDLAARVASLSEVQR